MTAGATASAGGGLERARGAAVALAAGLLVFDALAFFAGDAPADALVRAVGGTWGTAYGLGQVFYKATPLLCAGVGFQVAYRAGLFNIGVEGQLMLASLAAGVTGAALPAGTPPGLGALVVIGAAMAAGAGWSSLAGAMRVRFGAHEVIVTLLLNRVAEALVPFLLQHGAGASGYRTRDAVEGARIGRLDRWVSALNGSAVSWSVLLAVVACFAASAWLVRSRAGRELGWVGQGPDACRAQGVDVGQRLLLAMALSGALAGLGASATVAGYKGYYELGLGAGAGFGGVAVALLGRGNPWGMVGAALLLGTLQQAGLVLNASLPKEAMDVLTAAVILAVAAGGKGAR